jgi:hypothetical protein
MVIRSANNNHQPGPVGAKSKKQEIFSNSQIVV